MARRDLTLFQEVETDVPFPLEGLDETRAFMRQRKMTCASAQNVRSFDPQTDRARGAQRHGMVKYFPTFAAGNFPIQDLNHLVVGSGSAGGGGQGQGQGPPHSIATPVGAPPPAPGQFAYAKVVGSGFGVASGTNGTSIFTAGGVAGYKFACSCWDANGNVYVAFVNTTTGATVLAAYTASGTLIWSVTGPTVATGANRNVAGLAANATTGALYVAVTAATAPVYRIWVYGTSNGGQYTFANGLVPLIANDSTAAFSGKAANLVSSLLTFSTAAVNCMALLAPGANADTLGVDCSNGSFVTVSMNTTATSFKTYVYTGLTKSATVRSRVVSDGTTNWYVLASVTNHRLLKITSAGVIAWGLAITTYDAMTPQDLAFDPTGPNYLVVVGTGSPGSATVVNPASGAIGTKATPGGVATWNAVGADGKGNWTFWRDSVAANDVVGTTNAFSTVWGPSTLANAVHSGASVNRASVQITTNAITVTSPTGTVTVPSGQLYATTCTATDTGGALTLTWSAANLPTGLTLDSVSGILTGVPSGGGTTTFTVTLTAADTAGGTGSGTVTYIVSGTTGHVVSVNLPGDQTGTTGTATSLTMQANDNDGLDTLTWWTTGLPPGLTLSFANLGNITNAQCVISGTPTAPGVYVVTVNVYDRSGAASQAVFTWTITGSATGGGGAREIVGLVVSNGEIRSFNQAGTTALVGGTVLNSRAPVVWSAPCLGNMFYVDGAGYYYYNAQKKLVNAWLPTAGQLPVDALSLPATLIALWRGRIVLSGLFNDPANWFMSAQLLPFDFNYSPATTTVTQAVAGNNAQAAGQIGDVITCLIPYTDDTMLFGCTHSIYQLTGDPMQGGTLTVVSHSLGMAWGRPFAIDPMNQVYFMGSDRGVYKMVPGALPVRISQAINKRLIDVDLSQNLVRMTWDQRNQGLAVFVTPYVTRATTHFFWEQRTNSWWPQVFANTSHDPMAVHAFNSDRPENEAVMFGGRDGYVRIWNEDAPTDDGTAIASYVVLGPLSTRDLDDVLLKELHATLGASSGNVTWQVYVGATAEAALASSAVASGTWSAGRNDVEYVRRSGTEVYLKLSASTPWTLERITARYAPQGRIRRRAPQ